VASIFLASFAMQESGCNADLQGGNGEQGMMQITPDKCGGAPDGDCKDPVRTFILIQC
jgi:membrane-bound lytic murein transglycosylase MltF